ncbi:MAG: UDP-N-acetylglucosamine 1-carboxyvinyltransferase, partial [Candidatus Paceibacterota bacterium]
MENNEKLLINGLAGRRELFGRLAVTGAKNSILKGLAASLLFGDRLTLTAVPDILDVRHMISLLADLGVGIDSVDDGYVLDPTNIGHSVINPTMAKHLRASVVLSGPLLARTGQVTFPHPGGCVIGKRPIDFFLEGFRLMGATVEDCDSAYKLTAPGGKLKGAEIFFKVPSVTGTETFMMAAVLAEGETVLKNAALEPEIIGLGEFLRQSGARIYGLGTPTIRISGGGLLTGAGQPFRPISDRIEAGSFIILSALCAKDVVVENINTDHLDALLHALHLAGVKLEVTPTTV